MTICLRRSSPQNAFQGLSPQAWDATGSSESDAVLQSRYKFFVMELA